MPSRGGDKAGLIYQTADVTFKEGVAKSKPHSTVRQQIIGFTDANAETTGKNRMCTHVNLQSKCLAYYDHFHFQGDPST